MPLKGVIKKDVIAGNEYKFLVDNVEITAVEVSGIDQAMQVVELPDGTAATSGRTEVSEFTIMVPEHHIEEIQFMDTWWQACHTPVLPTAYKVCVIVKKSTQGFTLRQTTTFGTFIKNRKSFDHSMGDGGTEMTVVEYTFSIDDAEHS